jgi:hypothetical protein
LEVESFFPHFLLQNQTETTFLKMTTAFTSLLAWPSSILHLAHSLGALNLLPPRQDTVADTSQGYVLTIYLPSRKTNKPHEQIRLRPTLRMDPQVSQSCSRILQSNSSSVYRPALSIHFIWNHSASNSRYYSECLREPEQRNK